MILRRGTEEVPSAQRLDFWNNLIGSIFPGMQVAARDIDAEWSTCPLGDISVSQARASRSRVSRWSNGSSSLGTGRGLIHLQSAGISTTTQRGASATLTRGDMTLCYADDPYEIQISDRNTMFVIDFPIDLLADRPVRSGHVVERRSAHAGMLHDFIGAIFTKTWPAPLAADDQRVFRDLVANLVVRSLSNDDSPSPPPVADDLRQRVLAFVEANLDQSQLRTGLIADRLSVPARRVQAVFAEMATTPSAYIIERRLARAAERLRHDRGECSITDLALDLGFSDCAHFTRRFKARFGISPGRFARSAQN